MSRGRNTVENVMKVSIFIVLWIIANVLGLAIIALVKQLSLMLAYEIGGIYAGILLGAAFSLHILSYKDVLSRPLTELFDDALGNTRINLEWKWRGNRNGLGQIIGIGLLLVSMTIIEGYTFFGHILGNNPTASITIMAIAGIVFGAILSLSVIWFELLIWQEKILFYAIALGVSIFLIAVVSGFSAMFFDSNLFFVVALATKNIASVFNKRSNSADNNRILYMFTAIVFMLFISVIYR